MKFPAKGTKGRTLIEYLATVDPMQIGDVMTALSDQLERAATRTAVSEMYARGLVNNLTVQGSDESRRSVVTDIIAISQIAIYALGDEDEVTIAAKAASLVPPRVVNVMTGPVLNPSRYLPTKGTRPDSDWSQFPSRQL